MIPALALIVSAYAGARLLNEYVLLGDKWRDLRTIVAVAALIAVGFFALSILSASSDLGDLGL